MNAAELASCLLQLTHPSAWVAGVDNNTGVVGLEPTTVRASEDGKVTVLDFRPAAFDLAQRGEEACREEKYLRPLVSPRGYMLVGHPPPAEGRPVITVEFAHKWYTLFVVHPSGAVTELGYDDLYNCPGNKDTTLYVDHVPNPRAVEVYAEAVGCVIDPLAHELLYGRWQLEVKVLS